MELELYFGDLSQWFCLRNKKRENILFFNVLLKIVIKFLVLKSPDQIKFLD